MTRALTRALAATAFALLRALHEERGRWFNWVPVVFALGIGAYFALPVEPSLAASALPIAAGLVARHNVEPGREAIRLAVAVVIIAGAGFLIAKVRAVVVAQPTIERTIRNAAVQGFVELVEPRDARGQRITIAVTALDDLSDDARPKRVRLRTLGRRGAHAAPALRPGDHIRLKATLQAPALPAQPGDYDFARSAWFKGIGAVGYTLDTPEIVPAPRPMPKMLSFAAAIERVRAWIGVRIAAALPGESGALATALITGERGGISEATISNYRASGLIHMLSISGLHMAVMAGAVFFAVRFLLSLVPALALSYPIKKWAALAGMAATLLYLAISGGAAATVRSALMMLVVFLAITLGRPAIALRNVAISALVILAVYPESLLDVGFQMSFAAVVALVAAYEAWGTWRGDVRGSPAFAGRLAAFLAGVVGSTLVAGFAVAPLGIYHFHTSQQYAAVANLIAIPICNFMVMPAALATLVALPFGLEAAPLAVMGLGLAAIGWTAGNVAALPGAVTRVAQISDAGLLLIMAGGLWLSLWGSRWRLLGLPVVLGGVVIAPWTMPPDILIGGDGRLVALRQEDGRLSALAQKGHAFELSRWLEQDGDGRGLTAVQRQSDIFRCDGSGCAGSVGGLVVAVSRHPSSLADDCRRADIVVFDRRLPGACTGPRLVLDRAAFEAGTHAIWIGTGGAIRVETVASVRGLRPWAARGGTEPLADRHRATPTGGPARDFPIAADNLQPPAVNARDQRVGAFASAGLGASLADENPSILETDLALDLMSD
ncbi:MAG: ComEC/Rec2 family competence protein [Hyphomicrobium sp.]|nr:ComEC/Rec2 family competence protein [Hyphomicrobium sp.]